MKILLMNDKLVEGGTEIYVQNLMKILTKQNNQVYLISFDKKNISVDDKNIYNITKFTKIDKVIFNIKLYNIIRKKIKEINPDVIILNNIVTSPITQLKAIQGYKTLQIVHDYGIICPKATCLKEDLTICKGCKNEKCLYECKHKNSKIKIAIKIYQLKKVEKLRKQLINTFISPSEKLKEYLVEHGYNSVCINNPIEINNDMEKSKKDIHNEIRKYIYVGGINKRKGIFEFIEAFNEFSDNKNVTLTIIGSIESKDDQERLEKLIKSNKKIEYLGKMDNNLVKEKIRQQDFSVVPSIWMENYPTTVLEAMALKNFVIGSNRGGIIQLLDNNRGITFDILNRKEIIQVLDKTFTMTNEEYKNVVENAYEYIKLNNSYETYYKKLSGLINKISKKEEENE